MFKKEVAGMIEYAYAYCSPESFSRTHREMKKDYWLIRFEEYQGKLYLEGQRKLTLKNIPHEVRKNKSGTYTIYAEEKYLYPLAKLMDTDGAKVRIISNTVYVIPCELLL